MSETATAYRPYVIDKNLGAALEKDATERTLTNADGLPAIHPTAEQKYSFDLRGWLLIPGVLQGDELDEMRDFCLRLRNDPNSIAEHARNTLGGPLERLADHPVVVGFMNEFVAYPGLANEQCYGFRMESSNLFYRTRGQGQFAPHNGNGMMRFEGDSHLYRCVPGCVHSGLTRVVWELNGADKDGGATLVVSGSHKGEFPAPESIRDQHSPLWDSYTCPPGSLMIFTEALTHSARPWEDDRDRIAIFSCYNTVNSKWHNWDPHPRQLETMPPKRQTLFRPVHVAGNLVGGQIH
ncbi:MAG: phytanoyl-CoA dioxygenase family protein [Candidatus Poribacteria bacterium]|nr:phytanoyl-CoA dioxygenase family protein [Candidatus Poribacteria bacterium]